MDNLLQFVYLKNRFINFGDSQRHDIPMQIVERALGDGRMIQTPVFDMDHIHNIDLYGEVAIEPDRDDYGSDRGYDEAVNDAYTVARENRKLNKTMLFVVDAHVDAGNISIVHDPFPLRHKAKNAVAKTAPVVSAPVEAKKATAKSK